MHELKSPSKNMFSYFHKSEFTLLERQFRCDSILLLFGLPFFNPTYKLSKGFLSVKMTLAGISLQINSIIPPPFLFRS